MTLKIGENSYQLWALDTNVLSEMLKDPSGLQGKVLRRSVATPAVLCISVWTLLELRHRPELFGAFTNLFGVIPFALLKTEMSLFDDEVTSYPDPAGINPILAAFSMLRKDGFGDTAGFFDQLFTIPEVISLEKKWSDGWKDDTLQSMLSLRDNFKPAGQTYDGSDADRFVEDGVLQHLAWRKPNWVRKILKAEGDLQTRAFPSLRMAFYTVFFRLYSDRRCPEPQDVFDIAMAPVTPFVDMVLTEAYQAEIVRKATERDPSLGRAKQTTLKEIRKW